MARESIDRQDKVEAAYEYLSDPEATQPGVAEDYDFSVYILNKFLQQLAEGTDLVRRRRGGNYLLRATEEEFYDQLLDQSPGELLEQEDTEAYPELEKEEEIILFGIIGDASIEEIAEYMKEHSDLSPPYESAVGSTASRLERRGYLERDGSEYRPGEELTERWEHTWDHIWEEAEEDEISSGQSEGEDPPLGKGDRNLKEIAAAVTDGVFKTNQNVRDGLDTDHRVESSDRIELPGIPELTKTEEWDFTFNDSTGFEN